MKKLTVLVDLDDTIEGLLQAWVDYLNTHHGTAVKKDDVTEWDVSKFFPQIPTTEVYAPLYNDEFWKTVEPFEDAARYLQKWKDDGHTVLIVTTSDYRTLRSKMENVLFRYFPMFTWNDVIITAHKQLVSGDVLVDDDIHNLIDGSYEKLLMDAPHNRRFDADANGMTRVMNWSDAYMKICEISQGKHKEVDRHE